VSGRRKNWWQKELTLFQNLLYYTTLLTKQQVKERAGIGQSPNDCHRRIIISRLIHLDPIVSSLA
jgi:hypothetical protein